MGRVDDLKQEEWYKQLYSHDIVERQKKPHAVYNHRMLLGHRDLKGWDIALYRRNFAVYNECGDTSAGQSVGMSSFNQEMRLRLIQSCLLVRQVVTSALGGCLLYPPGAGKGKPVDVLSRLATQKGQTPSALMAAMKKLFNETRLMFPPPFLEFAFDKGASDPGFQASLKFHLLWTGLGVLGSRIAFGPYVKDAEKPTTTDKMAYHPLMGTGMRANHNVPIDDDAWKTRTLVYYTHRELYHRQNHGVLDINKNPDLRNLIPSDCRTPTGFDVVKTLTLLTISKTLPWVNTSMLSIAKGFDLCRFSWTLLHEISHLFGGTVDAVEATKSSTGAKVPITEIYLDLYDRTGKRFGWDSTGDTIVSRTLPQGSKVASFGTSAAVGVQASASKAYNRYKSYPRKHELRMPADSLTCLLFLGSEYFRDIKN